MTITTKVMNSVDQNVHFILLPSPPHITTYNNKWKVVCTYYTVRKVERKNIFLSFVVSRLLFYYILVSIKHTRSRLK